MTCLAILGASGHGKVIADTASLNNYWTSIIFFDDTWPDIKKDFSWKVEGNTETLLANISQFTGVIVGIGNNLTRQTKYELLKNKNAPLATIIHPTAYVSVNTRISEGSVIFANAVVNIDTEIGTGSIVNTSATIDHDCKLADYTHISPGVNLGGNVSVGCRSWVGIGSSVKQCINIGNDVIIGAGSSVIRDIPDKQVVVGTPTKPISPQQ